jgi:hypothetical protein
MMAVVMMAVVMMAVVPRHARLAFAVVMLVVMRPAFARGRRW